jgi:hypothetical protein
VEIFGESITFLMPLGPDVKARSFTKFIHNLFLSDRLAERASKLGRLS